MYLNTVFTIRGFAVVALAVSLLSGGSIAQAPVGQAGRAAEITGTDVYVRSGPSANHYPVVKAQAGDRVTVVGENREWLEVLPPEGVFSFISGDYVDTTDGKVGLVSGDNVRVRAGSLLPEFAKNKYVVQTKLMRGAQVSILSRDPDGYLRIEPPPGVTVWVHSGYVSILPVSDNGSDQPETDAVGGTVTTGDFSVATPQADGLADASEATSEEKWLFKGQKETPQRRALAELDELVRAELEKPVPDRDFEPISNRYEAIAGQTEDVFAGQYATGRMEQIAQLASSVERVRSIRKLDEQIESQRREFLKERAKIREEMPPIPNGLDALGVLRASALYPPGSFPERYRLVDPTARRERTIAYVEVRPNSSIDIPSFLGRYVGVRAAGRRLQTGGIQPVPIYVLGEIVLLGGETKPDPSPDGG